MALVEASRVVLRLVEDTKIEASVKDKGGVGVAIEWATGTGPQALRSVCTCGSTGVCEHVVATLETVRTATDAPLPVPAGGADTTETHDYGWLPDAEREAPRARARSVWPVLSSPDGKAVSGALYLDTPRLRGVIRDAESILAMMDSTPVDDWDDVDRELIRDEAIVEAFGQRVSPKALARALFRLARHPRLRFDDHPGENRHPAELAPFAIDLRGVRLRAARHGDQFVPMFERADGERFSPRGARVLDGPPAWLIAGGTAYLLDGTFNARKTIMAAEAVPSSNGASGETGVTGRPSSAAIARVAPFLSFDDRSELGVADAEAPALLARMAWRDGALLARLAFVDRATGARAAFSTHGAVASHGEAFVRFAASTARAFAQRFVAAGFVPRGGDVFALHDAERAATLVRDAPRMGRRRSSARRQPLGDRRARRFGRSLDQRASVRRDQRLVRSQRRRLRRRRRCAHANRTRRALAVERTLRGNPRQALRRR